MYRYIVSFYGNLFNQNENIEFQRTEKMTKKMYIMLRIVTYVTAFSIVMYLCYSLLTRGAVEKILVTTINIEKHAKINVPYESIDDFIESANPCKKIHKEAINNSIALSNSPIITVNKNEQIWSMVDLNKLFTYMQNVTETYRVYEMNYFCSTMMEYTRFTVCLCNKFIRQSNIMVTGNIQ